MRLRNNRVWAVITLFFILLYGIFKIPVLRVYASLLKLAIQKLNLPAEGVLSFLYQQGDHEDMANYSLGWIIYYPSYLFLHLVFIHLLFTDQPKLKRTLSIILTVLVFTLVAFWLVFLELNLPSIAGFFRDFFYKLFGLPFILLSIEGGRILYNDLQKRFS